MILIKNGTVIDGTGNPRKQQDILIREDVIAAIGNLKNQKADQVIDAKGLTVTPGFIDINTDSDHYLSIFSDPHQDNFLLQGVTTIIGGHSGSSLAPLVRGNLKSIRKWADINTVNVNWSTVEELFENLQRVKLGINFGTLVGHLTIRRGLIEEENRHLTKHELAAFQDLLKQSLKEGAFGFSTGLRYNHAKHAPYEEIIALTQIVAKHGGLYATHLRDERAGIAEAVDEVLGYARETGVKTLITHFRALKGFENEFEEAYEHIENAAKEIQINFDGYPFDYSIIPLYTLLAEEHRGGNLETMCERIADQDLQNEIMNTFPKITGGDVIIAQAQGFDYLVGKTIGEFASTNEITIKSAILKLMNITKLRAVLFRKNINLKKTIGALFSENGYIASNSPSRVGQKSVINNERAATTFSTFLEMVIQKTDPVIGTLQSHHTLEWAIRKITGKPADLLGIKKRGYLKEGNFADIAILKNEAARHVFVNGAWLVKDREINTEILPGRIIKK